MTSTKSKLVASPFEPLCHVKWIEPRTKFKTLGVTTLAKWKIF